MQLRFQVIQFQLKVLLFQLLLYFLFFEHVNKIGKPGNGEKIDEGKITDAGTTFIPVEFWIFHHMRIVY